MKNKKALFFILVLILSFAVGCSSSGLDGGSQYMVKVTTSVKDQNSKVINNASVKLKSGGQPSDSGDGIYTFQIEGEKEYTFIANAPYYAKQEKTIKVGKSNTTISFNLSKKTATISGVVVEEDGLVKNAQVRINDLNISTTTNEKGEFSLENVPLQESKYTIEIEKDGYGRRTKEIQPQEGTMDIGNISLSNIPGTIRGTVMNTNDERLKNILITVSESGKSTTTDENGEFVIEHLPGDYHISISNSKYESYQKAITVEGDQETFVNINLDTKSGKLTGKLRHS